MRALSLTLVSLALALAGCGGDDDTAADTVRETGAVATTTTVEGEVMTVVEQAPIVVESPREGATVTSPVRVRGTASVFEAALVVRILGDEGETLAEVPLTALTGAPERGEFSGLIAFQVDEPQDGTLEVFSPSAEDGSEQHKVTVPIRIEPGG